MFTLRMAVQAALLPAVLAGPAMVVAGPLPELEMVTVLGKLPQPLGEAAATVSVITAGQLEAALAFDVRDALRHEPGLSVRRDPQRFGLGAITVRGLTGNRVLMETDGVPAASGFAIGSYSDTGRPFSDLELVKRIEILKGPASTLYGSDAIAGVVATTTLDPADLLTGSASRALRFRSGYSSDDHSAFSGLTAAGRSGDFDTLLAYARREGGELQNKYRSVDANPRRYATDSALARVVYHGLGQPLRLTLGHERQHALTDVDSLELSGGRFANTVFLRGDDSYANWRVVLDQRLQGIGPLDHLEWRLYGLAAQVKQSTQEERRAASPRSPAVAIARMFDYRERKVGGELTLARLFEAVSGPHQLVGGVEFTHSSIAERRDGSQTTMSTGMTTTTVLGEALPVRDFPLSDVTETGLYLQDEWRPGDGRWSLIPALRADWYRLEPRVDAMYAADNPLQAPVSVRQASVSPKLGASFRARDDLTLFLQYSHGFRSQPFEDVNIGLDLPLFNTRAIPNPDLRPEQSDSLELGARFSGAHLSGSVSVFHSRYRDFIESKVNIGVDPATGTTLFQSLNIGKAEIEGAEAALALSLGGLLPAMTGLTTRLSAAYARGEDTARGVPINSIDPMRATLGLGYESPAGRWSGLLSLTAVDRVRRVDTSRTPLFVPGGYQTLDLTGSWQVTDRLRLNAGLFNLADARYFEWADVRGRAPGDPLLELWQQPGRSASITLTADF